MRFGSGLRHGPRWRFLGYRASRYPDPLAVFSGATSWSGGEEGDGRGKEGREEKERKGMRGEGKERKREKGWTAKIPAGTHM